MSDTQSIDGRDTDRRKVGAGSEGQEDNASRVFWIWLVLVQQGDISKYMSDSDLDKTDSEDEKPTHRSTR